MTYLVLIPLVIFAAGAVMGLAALLTHGLTARQAMRRARAEDLPGMLESSNKTLVSLTKALKAPARRLPLPPAPAENPASTTEPGGEGAAL
ncbi:hypothetical protein [Streptomyces sp. NPDC048442]|uniref:hypothetical protein n=1 Tax=Streptomyces sp. NPDC048442 TaxID=3154823 RepID=UPI003449BA93